MAAPGGISCIGCDSVGALGDKCRQATRSEQEGTGSNLSAGASTRGIRRFLFPNPPSHAGAPFLALFARVGILTRVGPLPSLSSRSPEGSAVSSSPTVIPHCGPFHSASLHAVIPAVTADLVSPPSLPSEGSACAARTAAPSRAFAAMNLLLYFAGLVAASLARQLVSRRAPHPWFLWGGGFDSSALVSASLHAVIPST